MQSGETQFEVRDTRSKQYFRVDDEYLNSFAKVCGIYATCIYLSLCRHADKEQACWPSLRLMAETHNISTTTVQRGLKILVKHNLIKKIREGKKQNNRYFLIDKSQWILAPENTADCVTTDQSPKEEVCHHRPITVSPQTNHLCHHRPVHSKVTHRRKHIEGSCEQSSPEEKEEIKKIIEIFDIFKNINPTLNYGNNTQRKAVLELIKALGDFEKVKKAAEWAVKVQGRPYSPNITNPYQLKIKISDLRNYLLKQGATAQSQERRVFDL